MQFVTFLPKQFNDGSRVKKSLRASVLDEAWRAFGGFTLEGPVTGAWVDTDDGKLYLDQSERLTIHCENHRLAEAEAFVRRSGRALRQKAMYFEVRYLDGVRILYISDADD